MSETVVFVIGQGLVTLLSVFFAFKYGRLSQKNAYEKEKNEMLRKASFLRNSLRDNAVVKRLRDKYRR